MTNIYYLEDYRNVPSPAKQFEIREEMVIRAIVKTFENEHGIAVESACIKATEVLRNGGTAMQAFEVAEAAIIHYTEALLRRAL